jgi:hypothetical protein
MYRHLFDAEIALFSRASVDTDSLSMTGNGGLCIMDVHGIHMV